ncbi:MAG: hypothetical protein MUF81_01750, partial [Verrucomicrobia bacterium]|nr:hypothetical protein [Verrucomicrobiota bacterium]
MRSLNLMGMGLCLCGLLVGSVRAETFELADGQTLTGDIVSYNENGLQLNLGGGKYERTPWTKFSQAGLKKLKQKPKIAPFVEPFIEIPQEERVKKTEIPIKQPPNLEPVPRSQLPKESLFRALFHSPITLISLLLIYAANVYAGYEIAVVRAYPPTLVCGISAVAPFIGPIVF